MFGSFSNATVSTTPMVADTEMESLRSVPAIENGRFSY